MVFKGKSSLGCSSCRKVHVKCDEGRPECSRCVRLKRSCTGYREPLDLMFRHKDFPVQHEYKTQRRKDKSPKSWLSNKVFYESSWIQFSPALAASQDDLALGFFYTKTLENLPQEDHARHLHLQLSSLYSSSTLNSALPLAALAISHAVYGRDRQEITQFGQYSRRCYVQAVSAISAALQHPDLASSDQILYAVLLLCGYETVVFDDLSLRAWGSHVDGAMTLLKLRGIESLSTPFARRMYYFIRRSSILSHIQTAQRIDPFFTELSSNRWGDENPEDLLLSETAHIPSLQSLATVLLGNTSCGGASEVFGLLYAANTLDQSLVDWVDKMPVSWSYKSAPIEHPPSYSDLSISSFVSSYVHTYPDVFIGRVWNIYRVSRLILRSIIQRAISWLSENANYHQSPVEITISDTITRNLVNDICASAPFLLGFEAFSKNPQPHVSLHKSWNLWPQNSMEIVNSTMNGRFSLLWPLHVASSVVAAPQLQRDWIMAQIRWLGSAGNIPQANLVANCESQILSGGVENFRFDCV